MKKILVLFCLTTLVVSCSQPIMYNWCDYERTSYDYYKKQSPESTQALMKTYKKMIAGEQSCQRKVVPPGIHAEYGYLLIQNGQKDLGIDQWRKEIESYPESATFINRIIKLTEQ